MRKYTPLIGCLRHNPRHSRFPIPNTIWAYNLKPIEFVLLSYLCCQHSHGSTNVSPEMIAKGTHVTTITVKKYLASLVGRKLITDEEWSFAPAFHHAGNRKFFTLPNEIFLLSLPPSAFMVYAYLLLIEDRRTHTCHPSYNTIAAVTGLAKNTAMKKYPHADGDGSHRCGAQQLLRQARDEVGRQQPLHDSTDTAGCRPVPPVVAPPIGTGGKTQTCPKAAGTLCS